MPATIKINPVTRIEGHLGIEVTIDVVAGRQQVVGVKSSSTTFRGFEILLIDRDPRDAIRYTQRICGMCSVSHGMASVIALESAFGVLPPDNARILRNLVLGAEYIMSHTLHFYHLTLLDYINTEGIIGVSPWISGYVTADMVTGATAKTLFNHYIQALAIRRKAHQMAAIFGAKLPCPPTFVLGGFTEVVTTDKVSDFRGLLTELRQFIYNVYIPDVYTIAGAFRNYFNIGVGCGNLLAYGVFDLDITGANLLPRGRYTNGVYGDVDPTLITEYVRYSWYTAESGTLNPRGV